LISGAWAVDAVNPFCQGLPIAPFEYIYLGSAKKPKAQPGMKPDRWRAIKFVDCDWTSMGQKPVNFSFDPWVTQRIATSHNNCVATQRESSQDDRFVDVASDERAVQEIPVRTFSFKNYRVNQLIFNYVPVPT